MALAAAGCTSVVRTTTTAPGETPAEPAARSRYEPEAMLSPETIANLRAAPAPAQAEFSSGKNWQTDEDLLGATGYVRIGVGTYEDAQAAGDAVEQAREVGADKVLVYAPAAPGDPTRAAFYVRMKLPFGATFRDLTATERQQVGGPGVELGSIVGGSPASRANLLPGDIVVQVDGARVAGKADFQKQLRAKAGHRVTLGVWRNGVHLDRPVRLGVPGLDGAGR
jgi:hypothetical protein